MMIDCNVQEPYWSQLGTTKVVECRLNRGKFANVIPGNILRAMCDGHQDQSKFLVVTSIKVYPSFEAMFCAEWIHRVLPQSIDDTQSTQSTESGIAIYRKFYPTEMEAQYGVVAMTVRLF